MSKSVLHGILDRSGFSPVTRENYSNIIDRWVVFAGPEPRNWTRPKAQDFYDWLLSTGISVKSANHYLASLRYVSKWYSIREGRPDADFAIVQMRADTHADKKRFALTQPEIETLLHSCVSAPVTPLDMRDLTMFVVGLETGMRRKSLVGLRIETIGQHARHGHPIARVPIKGAGGVVEYDVPLSDLAVHTINWWRKWLTPQRYTKGPLFARLDKSLNRRGTTWTPHGGGISLPMINKVVRQRGEGAELGHLHPHLLRHTFISTREAAGCTPVQIAAITGHSLVGADGARWGEMAGYIDLEAVGATARNTTPPWLTELVHDLTKG